MRLEIEVWLRGHDFATTDVVDLPLPEPRAWTDPDVRRLLEELLRAIERARNPSADPARPITLRGFSWIVSPFEEKGLLLSVEIQLGAAAAGPFDADQRELEASVTRVIGQARAPQGARAH